MSYDLMIVGAGIAGLRVGIESQRKGLSCCILERNDYYGGRTVTYHDHINRVGAVQWEGGAGRIADSHHKVHSLLKRYHLTTVPIDNESTYLTEKGDAPNNFWELYRAYAQPLEALPSSILATHTLYELLVRIHGKDKTHAFCAKFPYYSEVYALRADRAMLSFSSEMGPSYRFRVCREGLSALVEGMVAEFVSLGGVILPNMEVVAVQHRAKTFTFSTSTHTFHASTCVLALPSEAMKHIRGVSHLPVLSKVGMMPLLRMYAVFPTVRGKSWFADLGKVVTDDPIRYFIPMDHRTVMISYTDGQDAAYWIRQGKNAQTLVMQHIRRLFPDRTIPDPLFFRLHTWPHGCSYWLPGDYSVEEESQASLQPMPRTWPRLFVCSESFALQQCWVESALEQADRVLAIL